MYYCILHSIEYLYVLLYITLHRVSIYMYILPYLVRNHGALLTLNAFKKEGVPRLHVLLDLVSMSLLYKLEQ